MKSKFAEDAMRWEAGELPLDELEARHPEQDVRDLAEVWGQLAAIAEGPTPDPEPGWTALRAQLPAPLHRHEGLRRTEGLRWRARRTVAAAMAAALIGGTSIAYAAGVEPVRRGVDEVVDHVGGFFFGNESGNTSSDQDDSDRGDQVNTGTDQGNSGADQGNSNQGDQGTTGADQGNSGTDQGNTGTNQGSSDQGAQGNSGADQGHTGQ